MAYRMACNEPDFRQSVPEGNWTRVPDPLFPGSYRYRNEAGETVLVPAIWYTGLARERADWLRFCATRADEAAARAESGGKPWSASDGRISRANAAELRLAASQYQAAGDAIAGHVSGAIDAGIAVLRGGVRGYREAHIDALFASLP